MPTTTASSSSAKGFAAGDGRLLYPAALTALGLLFFHALWLNSGIVYSPDSDIIAYLVGAKSVFQRALWGEGVYPLWNPAVNCGTPAHANPAAMYAFPTHWLYWFLSVERATNLSVLLTALAAGLGMYALALRACAHRASAFFCGAAWMLCHRFLNMLHAGWFAGMAMYALAPWFFLCLDRLIERPSARRAAALASVAWLCLIQGFTQLFYYAVLGAALYAAWRLRGRPNRERLAVAGFACLAAVLALLLSAPVLLPQLEFVSLSTRLDYEYLFFIRGAPTLAALKTLLDPAKAVGPETWERNFYFGLWLYPPCVLACWRDWRRNLVLCAACAALPLLCFDTPLLRLIYSAVPGFKLFRVSSRLLVFEQMLLVLLAGRGLDALLSWGRGRIKPAAAALLALAPLFDHTAGLLPRTVPLSEIFPRQSFYAPLLREAGNGRTAAVGRTAIPYGASGYLGIDMANGYEPLNLKHFEDYFSVLKYGDRGGQPRAPVVWTDLDAIAHPDMLRALDVETIVANKPSPLEQLGFKLAGKFDDIPVFDFYRGMTRVPIYLWKDSRPLGPAYFADSVAGVASEAASLSAIAQARSAHEAHVMGLDRPTDGVGFSGGQARLTLRGTDDYRYEVLSEGENFLILSQIWYPGWRADVDGRETEVYRVNHALIGCFVPPGRHILRLEMTSPRLRQGLVLFALGLFALGALYFGVGAEQRTETK